jgi:hypothetical protein
MSMRTKRNFRQIIIYGTAILVAGLLTMYMLGCFADRKAEAKDDVALVLDWNRFILKAEMHTEGYRSPVISRAYGYIGLAAYETALPGMAGEFKSFSERFQGLSLPSPPAQARFDMMVAMNACYATMMRKFFLSAPEPTRNQISMISESWDALLKPGLDTGIIRQSKAYGRDVANAVYAWSATDSLGVQVQPSQL